MENDDITLLDANVLLRYFLRDDEKLYEEAYRIIDEKSCFVLTNILQEVLYVLCGPVYQLPRKDVADAVVQSFSDINYMDRETVECALRLFVEKPKMDFPDCMLLAYHVLYDVDVSTFDQKLKKKLKES